MSDVSEGVEEQLTEEYDDHHDDDDEEPVMRESKMVIPKKMVQAKEEKKVLTEADILAEFERDLRLADEEEDEDESDMDSEFKGRLLRAEDSEWAVCPVPNLGELCIAYIAAHFMDLSAPKVKIRVNATDWQQIMDSLPLDLPEEKLLSLLDDNSYWRRRGKDFWDILDLEDGRWRKLYAERRVAKAIESYVPFKSDIGQLEKTIDACKNLVTQLRINKLQVSALEYEEDDDEDFMTPRPYEPPNHTDIGKLLLQFPKLENLSLSIAPEGRGEKFDFSHHKFTENDGRFLANHLQNMPGLKRLRLYGCQLKLPLIKWIIDAIMKHFCTELLDFSYNLLDSHCCKPICRLLMNSSCCLDTLDLSYNYIGGRGVKYIGVALRENTSLKTVVLALNGINDSGGAFFVECLQNNNTLQNIDISGNQLGEESGCEFAVLIAKNRSLKTVNLSGNVLGSKVAAAMKMGMKRNASIEVMDVRLCHLGEEIEVFIRECISRNLNKDLNMEELINGP